MKMTRDELEYAISQYIDGNLLPLELAALEERLAGDAEARGILAEYRQLDSVLKNAITVPEIAWDRFANQIQQAVAQEELPTRNYTLHPRILLRGLAIAASILLVIGVLNRFVPQTQKTAGVAVISGPIAERSAGPIVAEIGIGPSPTVAANWRAGEEVVSHPTIVLIDQAHVPAQDNDLY